MLRTKLFHYDEFDAFYTTFDSVPDSVPCRNEEEAPYAVALDQAIEDGTITEPGTYAVVIDDDGYNTSTKIYREHE